MAVSVERQIQVAVAEDEPYLRRGICRAISECPELNLAGSADTRQEIVQLVLEQAVDVVLMDIEMDRYDSGIQAAAQIAGEKPEVIIIFLTVHDEDEMVYQAFSVAPNVDYMVKSVDYELVTRKICEAYEGRNRISPQIMRKLTGEFGRMRRKQADVMRFVNLLFAITPSEKELIRMLLSDMSVSQIASVRCVEMSTIKSQIHTMLKKFQMRRTKDVTSHIRMLELEQLFL